MKRHNNWLGSLMMAGSVAGLLWAVAPPASADGKALYDSKCKKCHGLDGKGDTLQGRKEHVKDMTTAEVQKLTDEEIIKVIKEGITDPKDPVRKMKKVDGFSEAEIKEIVKVIRSFKK